MQCGELEQEAELERLRQVAVEDVALVLDDDALVALAEPVDDLALLLHLVLAAEDAEVLVHRLASSSRIRQGRSPSRAVEQRLQLALGVRDAATAARSTVVCDERPVGRVRARRACRR